MPVFEVRFYPFANINNTIRLREDKIYVRLSDVLEGAPEDVLHAIAHILIAKLYRKPIDSRLSARYRKHVGSRAISEKAHLLRQMRGRKRIHGPVGNVYDLNEIFEELNSRYFHGLLARPEMTWSASDSRHSLGHYDPAHNAIVVSRIFDHPRIPTVRNRISRVSRDAAPETSSTSAREPPLRPFRTIPAGREAIPSV